MTVVGVVVGPEHPVDPVYPVGEELLAQGAEALAILADTGDAAEPILRRSPDDTDQENTLATADIDLSGTSVRWAVYAPGADTPHHRFEGLRRL